MVSCFGSEFGLFRAVLEVFFVCLWLYRAWFIHSRLRRSWSYFAPLADARVRPARFELRPSTRDLPPLPIS